MRFSACCDSHRKKPRSNEEKKGRKEGGREGAGLRLLRESSAQLGMESGLGETLIVIKYSGARRGMGAAMLLLRWLPSRAVWLSQDALPLAHCPTTELCGSRAPGSRDTFSLEYLLYSELYGSWAAKSQDTLPSEKKHSHSCLLYCLSACLRVHLSASAPSPGPYSSLFPQ